MIIFGIDPGTNITGYGVINVDGNKVRWVDSGIIRTNVKSTLADRLSVIYDGLVEKMTQHAPHVVCVEEAFFAKNVHTTLILGHARGVAMLAAQKAGAVVEEYSPREIKKSVVGSGAAEKKQVEFMVKTMLNPPGNHDQSDAYDALAAALCGFSNLSLKRLSVHRCG